MKLITKIIFGILALPVILLLLALFMPVFISGTFIAVGLYVFYLGLRNHKWKRLVEDTPTSKIHAIAMGFVEVKGKVETKNPLTSPLTKKPCVWYSVDMQHKGDKGWRTIQVITAQIPFLLYDATGKVDVWPEGIEVGVEEQTTKMKEPEDELPKEMHKVHKIHSYWDHRRLRLIEKIIPLTKPVYIMGTAYSHPTKKYTKTSMEGIIIGKKNGPFYISDRKEIQVIKTLQREAILYLIIGVVFTTIGAGALLAHLGLIGA